MATYSELMAQAQALMAQAEQTRKDELASVIADIKAKMKQYGITVADLGGAAGTKKPAKSKSKAPAKYKGPNGELRRNTPCWVSVTGITTLPASMTSACSMGCCPCCRRCGLADTG